MSSRNIRRKYGQNYLKDPAILFDMGDAISPQEFDSFIENNVDSAASIETACLGHLESLHYNPLTCKGRVTMNVDCQNLFP